MIELLDRLEEFFTMTNDDLMEQSERRTMIVAIEEARGEWVKVVNCGPKDD
ncbi:MAG: hypothetical protein V3T88_01560 [Nitrosomonadaceae bacterium]